MKRILTLVAALALIGAGCAANDNSTESYGYTPPTEPSPASTDPVLPDSPAPTPEPSSTSTDMNAPLAFPGILPEAEASKKVRIKTNFGDIVIQTDAKVGPRAASNFVYLTEKDFYNGTIFHRVIPNFMIQGGDPTGTGTGGPGYRFDNDPVSNLPVKPLVEFGGQTAPVYEKGIVAMANAGPNTNGSQFFIMVADYPLGPDYSIFGKVIEGQSIVDKIAAVPRDRNDRPTEEVKMLSVNLE